jgi:heat shock protein HtpX
MQERIAANVRKSWLLVGGFVVFVAVIGWLFGAYLGYGLWGLVAALGVAAVMTTGSYFSSDRVALSMSRARPADPVQFKRLHNIIEGLSIAAGIPKPAGLHRRRSGPQRVRHRPRSGARRSRGDHRTAGGDEQG